MLATIIAANVIVGIDPKMTATPLLPSDTPDLTFLSHSYDRD